jgi:hypothetical protein
MRNSEYLAGRRSPATRRIRRFLGKLLKRGCLPSRKKEAEITCLPCRQDISCGHSRQVVNQQKGAGRRLGRRGSFPAEWRWPFAEMRLQRRITLVNAAFLLVTTAWFAGADPAPATSAAHPGAVASAPVAGGCCGGAACTDNCGCCDCCCKPSLWQRLRARRCCNCCECCDTCATTNCCTSSCGSHVSCDCGSCCEPCCCKPSFLQRLRARRCCCDSCCDSCCGNGCGSGAAAPPAAMPSAEPIKVLPKETTPKKSGAVQSHNQGLTPASSSNVLEANPF